MGTVNDTGVNDRRGEKIRFAGHDVFDVRYPDRRLPCSAAKDNVDTTNCSASQKRRSTPVP